jgi:hypothetical protein
MKNPVRKDGLRAETATQDGLRAEPATQDVPPVSIGIEALTTMDTPKDAVL